MNNVASPNRIGNGTQEAQKDTKSTKKEWHIITGEYPPQPGGVGDYTRLVASGLAAAGDEVHIWCPPADGAVREASGVIIHRELGGITPADLLRVGRMLDAFSRPRRILVQWVPHAYGFRSANIGFSLWLWSRGLRHKDEIEIMVHEPYLPLPQDRLRHTALAVAHRIMLAAVLGSSKRVWTAIPKWEEYCRPYTFGRTMPFGWLPVLNNIPVNEQGNGRMLRARYTPRSGCLVGHFGTCGLAIGVALQAVISNLLSRHSNWAVLLIGHDSDQLRRLLIKKYPLFSSRVHATGTLSASDTSSHISACDVMVQPYPDGATSRRGSLMACLAHGKPVVTTTGRLSEDLWRETGSVLLVPAGNDSQIAASIEKLANDHAEKQRLSAAAKLLYQTYFDLPKTIGLLRAQP